MSHSTLYNARFFAVFGGVVLFMSAVALQFHFGQYVEFLGKDITTLGWIMSISTLGAILIRLHIGRWIDRFGCRRLWLAGSLLFAVAIGSVQFVESVWIITVLRTLSMMAMSAVMTTVAVFAALVAPPDRRAESIGVIGLAGFLGMIVGPTLGDWILTPERAGSVWTYRWFFSAAAVLSLGATAVMWPLRGPGLSPDPHQAAKLPARRWPVIRAHWPGIILGVGLVFGMAFTVPGIFLERLAEDRGFANIKVFFLVYAPTAIVLRVLFRRVPRLIGRVPTVAGGLLLMAAGLLCLTGVQVQHELILPGFLMGAGHCFVFPSMVDLGAERLPTEHRGTGTALILGANDVGSFSGNLVLGYVIRYWGFERALIGLALTLGLAAAIYALTRRGRWR